MAQTFDDLARRTMSKASRKRAAERTKVLLLEMLLGELRQATGYSQKVLAAKLKMKQPSLSKLENASDMQVTTLQKQMKALQKKATDTENFAIAVFAVAMCNTAMTADAFQGTWAVIDQQAQAAGRPVVFGPQSPLSDFNTCRALQITRTPRVPPTVAGFSAILGLLQGSSAITNAIRLPS